MLKFANAPSIRLYTHDSHGQQLITGSRNYGKNDFFWLRWPHVLCKFVELFETSFFPANLLPGEVRFLPVGFWAVTVMSSNS